MSVFHTHTARLPLSLLRQTAPAAFARLHRLNTVADHVTESVMRDATRVLRWCSRCSRDLVADAAEQARWRLDARGDGGGDGQLRLESLDNAAAADTNGHVSGAVPVALTPDLQSAHSDLLVGNEVSYSSCMWSLVRCMVPPLVPVSSVGIHHSHSRFAVEVWNKFFVWL